MTAIAFPLPDPGILARRDDILKGLAALLPAECLVVTEDERRAFETDGLTAYRRMPLAVALPRSTEEVAAVFGVRADRGDEDGYRAAHRDLADLLPGPGPLAGRLGAHRDRQRVPRERLLGAARALADALRAATAATLPLPAGEAVVFRLVDDAPWAALHRYRGAHRSVVTLNAGAGLTAGRLARLVAHETYPGHHAERCRREAGLVARGWAEHRAVVANTPQALVAEGAAEIALRAAVGPGWGRWAQGVLAEAGVTVDGDLVGRVDAVTARLARARQDAVLMLHGARARDADVAAHLRRWLLVDDTRARQMLRFLHDPLWRLSTIAYIEGAELVGRWWDRDPSGPRLAELLDTPLTPADLRPNGEPRRQAVSEPR